MWPFKKKRVDWNLALACKYHVQDAVGIWHFTNTKPATKVLDTYTYTEAACCPQHHVNPVVATICSQCGEDVRAAVVRSRNTTTFYWYTPYSFVSGGGPGTLAPEFHRWRD